MHLILIIKKELRMQTIKKKAQKYLKPMRDFNLKLKILFENRYYKMIFEL